MKKNNEWMRDASMNLLVDYYTEVQFRPYGSGATRANVLPWLKELKLGYICIYAKGCSGYTTWPSSLKTQHNMLGQDMPKFFREVTQETGTKLFLYYSGLLDGNAGLRHPEWRAKNLDGSDKRYHSNDKFEFFQAYEMCPLSQYWDEWVAVHLKELIQNYDPDGIWVDGDWSTPCHCERCQARFRRETGRKESWSDIVKRKDFQSEYFKYWSRVLHGWRTRFCAFIKSLKPDCLYSAGNVSTRREFAAPFDWRSGDCFSPEFYDLRGIAFYVSWFDSLDVPHDLYICDTSFTKTRLVRSRTKTLDRMLQEAAIVAAHGGAVGYWTYPLGNGAFVPSRMRKAVAARRFLEKRKKVFLHTESLPWTAVLSTDPASPTYGGPGVEGAYKAFAALHRSPDVMDETGIINNMPHKLIVLPEQRVIPQSTMRKLGVIVRRGAILISSGDSIQSPELQKMIGVKNVRRNVIADGHVILKQSDEPTGIDSQWDALELTGAKELYPLCLSWDQFNPECRLLANNWPMHGQVNEENPEPAGFPAVVWRRVGKGMVVHICTGIFSQYNKLGDPQMLRFLSEIVKFIDPAPFFKTDAPSWMDVTLRRRNKQLLAHFVNCNPGRDMSRLHTDDVWVDEIPVIGPISCEIRIRKRPQKVIWEPEGKKIDFHYTNQILSVTIPKVYIHGCLSVLL